jgi:long-chain acyl-CoA synthetase
MATTLTAPYHPQHSNSLWSEGEETLYPPPVPIGAASVSDLFFEQAEVRGPNTFARFRDITDDQWMVYSWSEAAAHVQAVAAFLAARGVKPGDRVGIFAGTRYEWIIADLAILAAGGVLR